MQKTLREIDIATLALAMSHLTARQRDFIFLNVSKNAASLLNEEMERENQQSSEKKTQVGFEFFHQILEKIVEEHGDVVSPPPSDFDIEVRVSTKRDIIGTILALARLARDQGLLAIETVDASANPLLAKGLQMATDGWDPAILDAVLERTKETLVRDYEERLSMIIEGVEAIQYGDHPRGIETKLEAFITE